MASKSSFRIAAASWRVGRVSSGKLLRSNLDAGASVGPLLEGRVAAGLSASVGPEASVVPPTSP